VKSRTSRAKLPSSHWFLRPPPAFWSQTLRLASDRHPHTPLTRGKMPREAEISINEREFIKQALSEQIRLDGRAIDAFRSIELTFGEEHGVADVQLGKSRYARHVPGNL
jgi:hypothetical protein